MYSPKLKRIYETPDANDGKRILVDRLWPRGLRKDKAQVDIWLKEVAPSPDLRKWFGHRPELFDEFQDLYRKELNSESDQQSAVVQLLHWCQTETITLLYSAKDENHNHAIVLRAYLNSKLSGL